MSPEVFYVEALRWGSRENHSYVVGVFGSIERACREAVDHTTYRGGKYYAAVYQTRVDGDPCVRDLVFVAFGKRNAENEPCEFAG